MTAYLNRLYGPLTQLSNANADVMSALVSFDRVFEVLDLPSMITERAHAVALRRLTNGVIREVTVGTTFRSRRVTLGKRWRRANGPSDVEGDLDAEEDKGPEQDRQQRRQDAAKGLEAVKEVIVVGHDHANNHPHHENE
jgi:ABC-type multidrug transport system fused ATPase/permease subunit